MMSKTTTKTEESSSSLEELELVIEEAPVIEERAAYIAKRNAMLDDYVNRGYTSGREHRTVRDRSHAEFLIRAGVLKDET